MAQKGGAIFFILVFNEDNIYVPNLRMWVDKVA